MKHIKNYENNNIIDEEIVKKCKKLFIELYDNSLSISGLSAYPIENAIEFYFNIMNIKNSNVDDFINFLNDIRSTNNNIIIAGINYYVTISNIDSYIELLESKTTANKYNL